LYYPPRDTGGLEDIHGIRGARGTEVQNRNAKDWAQAVNLRPVVPYYLDLS